MFLFRRIFSFVFSGTEEVGCGGGVGRVWSPVGYVCESINGRGSGAPQNRWIDDNKNTQHLKQSQLMAPLWSKKKWRGVRLVWPENFGCTRKRRCCCLAVTKFRIGCGWLTDVVVMAVLLVVVFLDRRRLGRIFGSANRFRSVTRYRSIRESGPTCQTGSFVVNARDFGFLRHSKLNDTRPGLVSVVRRAENSLLLPRLCWIEHIRNSELLKRSAEIGK